MYCWIEFFEWDILRLVYQRIICGSSLIHSFFMLSFLSLHLVFWSAEKFVRFLLLQCSYGFSVNDDVLDQELGLYKAQTKLPFNAFGTMAMARDVRIPNMNILLVICLNRNPSFFTLSYYCWQEFEDNSASSQVFWLLKESELTPSNANILDGRYSVFGYVTENEDFLADVKVGDVIESIQVVSGLDNLANPSYKIAG